MYSAISLVAVGISEKTACLRLVEILVGLRIFKRSDPLKIAGVRCQHRCNDLTALAGYDDNDD